MALGGVMSALDRRYRRTAEAKAAVKVKGRAHVA
jgi:hypothetical protein